MNNRNKIILIIVPALVLAAFIVRPKGNLENYAQKTVRKCRQAEDKFSCYDREIPKLLKNLSMEDVFGVTQKVQKLDPSYVYCHVLGHNIASAETKKDPSKWKDVVSRCPAGVCSNGCVHGAFQEKFREENLSTERIDEAKNELVDICEAREGFIPSGLEQASCYHALGHLFMYITSADTRRSVELCDELAFKEDGRDFRPVCYDGAFMQIFQPLEREDEALIYGKVPPKNEIKDYCFGFKGEARYSCWNESWPVLLGNSPDGQDVVSFCSQLDNEGEDICYSDIFYLLPIGFNFDFTQMHNFCSNFPIVSKKKPCIETFAQRILEIDYANKEKAADFCLGTEERTLKKSCFEGLSKYAKFVFRDGTEESQKLCSYYPEDFKETCEAEK